jgi:hypothetical protein
MKKFHIIPHFEGKRKTSRWEVILEENGFFPIGGVYPNRDSAVKSLNKYMINNNIKRRMVKFVISAFIFVLMFLTNMNVFAFAANTHTLDDLLSAIVQVESGGNPAAVGDGGRAIGPFQIWEVYFRDAQSFDKSLKGIQYKDVTNLTVAKKVVLAYFRRYEPMASKNLNFEVLARLHNGGPGWRGKSSTVQYWNKVKKNLCKN